MSKIETLVIEGHELYPRTEVTFSEEHISIDQGEDDEIFLTYETLQDILNVASVLGYTE